MRTEQQTASVDQVVATVVRVELTIDPQKHEGVVVLTSRFGSSVSVHRVPADRCERIVRAVLAYVNLSTGEKGEQSNGN